MGVSPSLVNKGKGKGDSAGLTPTLTQNESMIFSHLRWHFYDWLPSFFFPFCVTLSKRIDVPDCTYADYIGVCADSPICGSGFVPNLWVEVFAPSHHPTFFP